MTNFHPHTIDAGTTIYTKSKNHYKKFIPTEMEVRLVENSLNANYPFVHIFRNADAEYKDSELYTFNDHHFSKLDMAGDDLRNLSVVNPKYGRNCRSAIVVNDSNFVAIAYPTDGRNDTYVAILSTMSIVAKAVAYDDFQCECSDHIFDKTTAHFKTSYVKETDEGVERHIAISDSCEIADGVADEIKAKYAELTELMNKRGVQLVFDRENETLELARKGITRNFACDVESNQVEVPYAFIVHLDDLASYYPSNDENLYVVDPNLPKPSKD